jgi:hypothetical protein
MYDLFISKHVVHFQLLNASCHEVNLSVDAMAQVYRDSRGVHVNFSCVAAWSVQEAHISKLLAIDLTLQGQSYLCNQVQPHKEEKARVITESATLTVGATGAAALTPNAALNLSLAKTWSEQKTTPEWSTEESTPVVEDSISHRSKHSIRWAMARSKVGGSTKRLVKQFSFALELGQQALQKEQGVIAIECPITLQSGGRINQKDSSLSRSSDVPFGGMEVPFKLWIYEFPDEKEERRFAILDDTEYG